VKLPSKDVLRIWPMKVIPMSLLAEQRKETKTAKPKNKPGPRPKLNYIKFEEEVHRILGEEGIPNPQFDPDFRQADLEKRMLKWHNDTIGESRNRELTAKALASHAKKFEADKGL
jgi:hypothetical protein